MAKLRGEKVRARIEVEVRLDFAAVTEAEFTRRNVAAAPAPGWHPAPDDKAASQPEPAEIWPAFLPAEYIEDAGLRIQAYRQLAGLANNNELEKLRETWRDRFGPLPAAADNLLTLARLKLAAARAKVQKIEVRQDRVMLTKAGELVLPAGKFPRLTSEQPDAKVKEIFGLLQSV